MNARDVVITHARRTPIGKFMGALSGYSAADLGVLAARAVLADAAGEGRPAIVPDLVILGCARQAGVGPNVARQVAVRSGLPNEVPAFTVNMACASGLKAIALAAQAVAVEEAEIVLCGGTESMSRVPHLLLGLREGYRLGHREVVDGMFKDGFHCPLADMVMAETVERNVLELYERGEARRWRERSDAYAAETQRRCEAARREGRFKAEIARIREAFPGVGEGTSGRRPRSHGVMTETDKVREIAEDEHPRDGVTAESLARLPPVVFQPADPRVDERLRPFAGTITAGNASGITDGAAALLVMKAARAASLGLEPLARLGVIATSALDPKRMAMGPVPAVRTLLRRAGRSIEDYDLVELNEAFAPQVLMCADELGIDPECLNVNGGAIALGHPIGCTGARITVTLLYEMLRRRARRGLATLCVSGGMGMAMELLRD